MNQDSNLLRTANCELRTEAAKQPSQTTALIVAAGSSARFGSDKLMTLVHGKPLFSYTLRAFAETPLISSIVLVVPPKREDEFRQLVDSLKIPHLSEMTCIIAGGNNRHESVQRGLTEVPTSTEFVAIHDAARPLITRAQIELVCTTAYKEGAAALALPVTETLHRADANGHAQETVNREQLWSMQTPQVFRTSDLKNLPQDKKKNNPTDEVSSLLEHGIKTFLIENREPNLKVTYQADLKIVEKFFLSSQ